MKEYIHCFYPVGKSSEIEVQYRKKGKRYPGPFKHFAFKKALLIWQFSFIEIVKSNGSKSKFILAGTSTEIFTDEYP